jgi:hypothetical protein
MAGIQTRDLLNMTKSSCPLCHDVQSSFLFNFYTSSSENEWSYYPGGLKLAGALLIYKNLFQINFYQVAIVSLFYRSALKASLFHLFSWYNFVSKNFKNVATN